VETNRKIPAGSGLARRPTFSPGGTYDLTFEIDAVATAEDRISLQQESELLIIEP
jgi:hypothetical protein